MRKSLSTVKRTINEKDNPQKDMLKILNQLSQIANRKIPLQEKVDKLNSEMLKIVKLN
jgi:hypothetical protein